jgi:CHRD domain-containing protein
MTFNGALFFLCMTLLGAVQGEERFRGRLSPVPIDATTRATVTGSGSVTAVLTGTTLSITGTFEGLGGPATVARLHQGAATGVRGPALTELTISKATRGTLSGTVTLTAEQAGNLKNGRLYIQIHSEKAPDGNLWGWLLR